MTAPLRPDDIRELRAEVARAARWRYPWVPESISGRKFLDSTFVQKKLGTMACAVWVLLMQRRDEYGWSSATIETISSQLSTGRPNANKHWVVRRALKRLENAGIVVEVSRRNRLWRRKVLGARPSRIEGWVVPSEVAMRLNKAVGHGGARKGAGRKMKLDENLQVNSRRTGDAKTPIQDAQVVDSVSEGSGNQDAQACIDTFSKRETDHSIAGDQVPSSKEEGTSPSAPSFSISNCIEKEADGQVVLTRSTRIKLDESAAVLPYELTQLHPAEVPSPPKLKPDMSEDDQLLMMIRAYKGACESRFGKNFNAAMSIRAIDRKRQAKLLEIAQAFIDEDISPFGWAAFSCDVWKRNHKRPPRIDWVFLISRVEERSGWFKSELSDYTGKRVVYGPLTRKLLEQHQTMRFALMAAQTDEERAKIRHRFFPDDTYELWVEKARAEGDAERTRLVAAVKRGEWMKGW